MNKIAILTDFISHDPAYSLCSVVFNQVKMLSMNGYRPRVLVREGFDVEGSYLGKADGYILNPGDIGQNTVSVTDRSEMEIASLYGQMKSALDGVSYVITHDMIYQPNQWKYHVAARRVAKETDIQWIHFVHSATSMGTAGKTGMFRKELEGRFPNSRLAVFHNEEINRKGAAFGYEVDEIVVIPNAMDLTEHFHDVSADICADMSSADVIAVYPCRLDRGKQPHILVEVFGELVKMGYDARVVIVDFHSTSGDKSTYRDEIVELADKLMVDVQFTSSYPECEYHVPHKVVMDLFEYGDILIHPSMSESDPLIIPEAMWKGCGMILNFDLPLFRQYDGKALFYKFSSAIDVNTGEPGETATNYANRAAYMAQVAAGIAYVMENNPVLYNHAYVRKNRSLEAIWSKHLWPTIGS